VVSRPSSGPCCFSGRLEVCVWVCSLDWWFCGWYLGCDCCCQVIQGGVSSVAPRRV
jgi:hypothetical protein